jgi:tRNA-specific 2-thiouridylase
MRVAAALNIPFLTCDAEVAYHDAVATEFIAEYEAGRTPNPDILCNKFVKFGAFLDFARVHGADFIATGHYAQCINNEGGRPELHRGRDLAKDQSYFLWSLSQTQLNQALFPVGNTEKSQIRNEAAAAGLLTAGKQDSQGICFLGHVDIPEFLSHYFTLTPGAVLDTNGTHIGTHRDARVYTLGQRHGFTISTHDAAREPHYVVARDLTTNTITVDRERPVWTIHSSLTLNQTTFRTPLVTEQTYEAQFRYRQTPIPIKVTSQTEHTLTIQVLNETDQAASGQSCVLYDGSLCLGGGIIN